MYPTLCFCAIGFLLFPGRIMHFNPAYNNRTAPPPYNKTSTLTSTLRFTDAPVHATLGVSTTVQKTLPGPRDCTDVKKAGKNKSGIYRIWPICKKCHGSFYVYCDMETDGGAWTVIQRRGDYKKPRDYFYRTWKEYKRGFGNITQDFWLGNDKIFLLTNQGNYSLRIDMKDKEGNKRFAFYKQFWIENEKHLYKLHLSGFKGNAGDSFSNVNGMAFSTTDRDNDIATGVNCAKSYKGGWWYSKCHEANLNGLYLNGTHKSYADGIEWRTWKGLNYSLSEVEMKIRRI